MKRPRDSIPTPDKLDEGDDLADSMTIEPIEAPSMNNGINGHMNGMPSLLETGLKNERNSTNGSTGDGMDDEARLFTFEKRIRIFSFSQLFSPYVSILFLNNPTIFIGFDTFSITEFIIFAIFRDLFVVSHHHAFFTGHRTLE